MLASLNKAMISHKLCQHSVRTTVSAASSLSGLKTLPDLKSPLVVLSLPSSQTQHAAYSTAISCQTLVNQSRTHAVGTANYSFATQHQSAILSAKHSLSSLHINNSVENSQKITYTSYNAPAYPSWMTQSRQFAITMWSFMRRFSTTQQQQQQQQKEQEQKESQNTTQSQNSDGFPKSKAISLWLFACCGIIAGIVLLGGVTRLTRSGLSMVEWKPLDIKAPTTQAEWEAEFDKYKQYPEYQKVNVDMSLEEFKFIYYMEYAHRLAGRLVGVVFGVPLLFLLARGSIQGALAKRLGLLFAMGGTQGAIGWWMVSSGLKEQKDNQEPKVSPYRLATHLTSAFLIYGIMLDTAMKVWPATQPTSLLTRMAVAPAAVRGLAMGALHLSALTIVSGVFVAGNRAGLIYNEWPLMGGKLVPDGLVDPHIKPAWKNVFENHTTVQFDHRMLAYAALGLVAFMYTKSRGALLSRAARLASNVVMFTATGQVALGISTLLTQAHTHVAATHQAGALTLFSTLLWLVHTLGPKARLNAAVRAATTAASSTTTTAAAATTANTTVATVANNVIKMAK